MGVINGIRWVFAEASSMQAAQVWPDEMRDNFPVAPVLTTQAAGVLITWDGGGIPTGGLSGICPKVHGAPVSQGKT